jgi:hypothetical protein
VIRLRRGTTDKSVNADGHELGYRCENLHDRFLRLFRMAFEQPTAEVKRAAVGDLSGLPAALQRAFAPDSSEFESIPKPEPHEWLALHDDPGQTFDKFKASRPNRPTSARRSARAFIPP